MFASRVSIVLAAAFGVAVAVPAAEPPPIALVKSVPVSVNSVAVINVAQLLASPRAVKDGWSKLDSTEYLAGAVPVHPSVERILLAKDLRPQTPTRGGTIAIIPLKKDADLKRFAELRGGEMTTIAGADAVQGKNGTYTVALDPRTLGSMMTESRQEVARWLKYAREKPTRSLQSDYINRAIAADGTRHHIFVVVDNEDLFAEKHAGLVIGLSELLKGKLKESQAIEAYLKSLQGIRLGASVTVDGIAAELQLDGRVKPQVDPALLKAFLVELFDRNGARLEDFPAAAVKLTEPGTLRFTFKLTDAELANVMALFLPPMTGISDGETIRITPQGGPSGSSSGRYYRAVNAILDDLKQQNRRAVNFQATALWHETAANRIETLSIIGADKAVVEYAHGTAARLRAVADSLRGQPVKTAILESQAYLVRYYPPPVVWIPGFGFQFDLTPSIYGSRTYTNIGDVQRAILEVAIKDAENRKKLWEAIDSQRSVVRNEMAKKYSSEFESLAK